MINVEASKITKNQIFYECKFCWTNKGKSRTYGTKYLKNGKEAINRIPKEHHHGNENDSIEGNWETYRSSHCTINDEGVKIHITDNTTRL